MLWPAHSAMRRQRHTRWPSFQTWPAPGTDWHDTHLWTGSCWRGTPYEKLACWISARVLPSNPIFLLDMVLPQLDAYHAGRQLQHLEPWISVELAQQRHEANNAQSSRLDTYMKPTLGFMSSSCSQRALRFCSSVIRLLSPTRHLGTYVQLEI